MFEHPDKIIDNVLGQSRLECEIVDGTPILPPRQCRSVNGLEQRTFGA